jgi:5-methyltetrahydrofolate--homocysteine methyltransferase
MSVRETLNAIAAKRVLVLDGAMGSMIQTLKLGEEDFRGGRFAGHKTPLAGCNDLLCLTRPQAIGDIHEAYLKAGADIIETCSFNSTAVSLEDYGIGDLAYEISAAAAHIARKAADAFSTADKLRFVAGSMGPTGKSAGLSPDVNDPARRSIYWDELEAAFYDNARGLLDGGADILLLETIFDSLNAKAALFAIRRLLDERNIDVPVIISATITGESGRLLSGQSLEAFCASVLHAGPWAMGLNCSFGAEKLLPHVRCLSAVAPCFISAHPNAGLPNKLGAYDESPESMAVCVENYLQEGLLNVIGGCCGTTPAHIAAMAAKAAQHNPRPLPQSPSPRNLLLSGLEPLEINTLKPDVTSPHSPLPTPHSLILIGERTNVSGSRKFLRLISEGKYNETLAFARGMIEDGAKIINVGMDDAMLDAEKSMCAFLDLALSDPEIARVPVMIDSSRWNVIEAGLKRLPGKGLVNSINLKDGEVEFLRRALLIKRYGASAVVMLIDEKGQAVSYDRKIEIAGLAYRLLVDSGFPPENIVFDPNVLAVATGISEHDSCGIDFIRACSWIRDNCPGVNISGGISNLSYSFRGNNKVREAMHSVFLVHAQAAGLSMAIVNPAALVAYNTIEDDLRNAVEDVILNRSPGAAERLLELAEKINAATSSDPHSSFLIPHSSSDWRNQPVEKRIVHAMLSGIDDFIEADALELLNQQKTALEIIEGPLMDGMKEVGKRFDEGTIYLPHVIRSARVMKKAAAALEPYMGNTNTAATLGKIILATVKGDVHDIGKNIVGIVLACNGYQVIDLGVMVAAEQILDTAEKEQAAIIGLSGLIAPSLDEMVRIAREMQKRRMKIPLLVGGAAASLVHTSLRLAPEYSGPVVYVQNAGKSAETVRALLSDSQRSRFLQELEKIYHDAAQRHEEIQSRLEIISLESARANRVPPAAYKPVAPKTVGIISLDNYPINRVIPYIDWQSFLRGWETQKVTDTILVPAQVPDTILDDTKRLLEQVETKGLLQLRGVAGIFPAASKNEDIIIIKGDSHSLQMKQKGVESEAVSVTFTPFSRFCFRRNLQKKPAGVFNPCLADFIAPAQNGQTVDWLGLFALSAGFGLEAAAEQYRHSGDDYSVLLLASIANALAEAFTEELHLRVRREWWGYAPDESLSIDEILKGKFTGIRPAFGYPSCPNHEDKRIAFELLEAEKRCGMKLTDTAMIIPAASVCGMFFASPAAYYFSV